MADLKIRVELTTEQAKAKLRKFDEERDKAKRKGEKAAKRKQKKKTKDARPKKKGALGTTTSIGVALMSPKQALVHKALEKKGGALAMISKLAAQVSVLTEGARLLNIGQLAVAMKLKEQGGVMGAAGEAMEKTARAGAVAIGLKAIAQETLVTETKVGVAFAEAKMGMSVEALAGVAEFAAKQAMRNEQLKTHESARDVRLIGDAIFKIAGLAG